MRVHEIMTGAVLVEAEKTVLFGCPPEIIKAIMKRSLPFPEAVVLPDIPYRYGVVQNATEFVLYYFLFMANNYNSGKKLVIAGRREDVDNNLKLLRLSLLGPTKREYLSMGDSPHFGRLYQESRALSLKDPQGREYAIEDLVSPLYFENDRLDCSVPITHENTNIYTAGAEKIKIDINISAPQRPPYELIHDYTPRLPLKFGIDVLGGGSGFTPDRPCSSLLLNHNSEYMLIDCPPYLDYSLNSRGISKNQISSIFLTHIHDDHCNIFPLLEFNDKVKFLGTKEIFWMAIQKLACQTGADAGEFYSYFDFIELTPYSENYFYGVTIIPHYTVHSIPTTGAIFRMRSTETFRTFCFTGDNKAVDDIDKMLADGLLSKRKVDYIKKLYERRFNLFVPDGGMGILHGDPKDSSHSKSDSVVFVHLEKLPSQFDASFSLANEGKRYNLIESNQHIYHSFTIRTMQMLQQHFPGIGSDWTTAMLNDMHIAHFNADDIVIKQGSHRNGYVYVLLSGRCMVKHHDGSSLRVIARKECGDFVGEMAIVNRHEIHRASVVADTPVVMAVLDERLFYRFLEDENRLLAIINTWKVRAELERFEPFSFFPDSLNEFIARKAVYREVQGGETVVIEGDQTTNFYIILKGRFEISQNATKIGIMTEGGLFGEYASLRQMPRTATVKALETGALLELNKEDINTIVFTTPVLNFFLQRLMQNRIS